MILFCYCLPKKCDSDGWVRWNTVFFSDFCPQLKQSLIHAEPSVRNNHPASKRIKKRSGSLNKQQHCLNDASLADSKFLGKKC